MHFVFRLLVVISFVVSIADARPAWAVDAPLKEDRIRFIIHDQVAGQMSAAELGGYLDTVHDYFHGSQDTGIDVPTCTDLGTTTEGGPQPYLYTSSGGLANDLAVIDDETELFQVLDWGATQGSRVAIFVQDILWCGAPVPNTIGCAPQPGNVFVVSLTAPVNVRGMVIGHERGHNAGLAHRSDDSCALMFASAAASHGCLNQVEAKALYNQANISTGETCDCIDVKFQGPSQTWTLNPQGTPCDDASVCSTASSCDTGLCVGTAPLDCDDADLCTDDECDPVTGCFNPTSADFTPCWDSDVCNGYEFCLAGSCGGGTPLNCDDALYCNGPEVCDPVSGCEPGTPPVVDDLVDCTLDSCDEQADTIVHIPDDASCANGDFCDGDETCDPQIDCVAGTPPPLDDGIVCTLDSCNELTDSIDHTPDDAACSNGAYCDGDESCDAVLGCQAGTAPLLDDGVLCTFDACDESADQVIHVPMAEFCDDGDICTAESCDEISGCENAPIVDCVPPAVPGLSLGGTAVLALMLSAAGVTAQARRLRLQRDHARG